MSQDITNRTNDEWTVEGLANDLRRLGDIVERHPELAEAFRYGLGYLAFASIDREELQRFARMMADEMTPDKWGVGRGFRKEYQDTHMRLVGYVGSVQFSVGVRREEVCQKVVTGYETRSVPDPDAPKVQKTVEVVQWLCGDPLLSEEGSNGREWQAERTGASAAVPEADGTTDVVLAGHDPVSVVPEYDPATGSGA